MDSLVGAVSFIWSVCCNKGQLLTNRDLLRGATIRPMASELAKQWNDIRRAVLVGVDAVHNQGLEYGLSGQYSSLNALSVVWAWSYVAIQWEKNHPLTVLQRDDFEKKLSRTLSEVLDRWLICSQWAGRWSGSSGLVVGGYAKALHEDFIASQSSGTLDQTHKLLSERFQMFVKELETDASNYVNNLAAGSRERVSIYRTALWMWHRLDATRWQMSSISLRVGKSKPVLDVDHAVAFALWDAKLTTGLPTGVENHSDALALINMLGNSSLLEKTFNISKSAKTLSSFMKKVHEFKEQIVALSDWADALGLDDSMLDASAATVDAIGEAIEKRDTSIRVDLVEFVKGTKSRKDL
jgi:hypothetical protein